MKIKKIVGGKTIGSTLRRHERGVDRNKAQETTSQEEGDTVTLSHDALAAAEAGEVEPVSSQTATSGPLPDPMATSQAILEKELAAWLRRIRLLRTHGKE